MAAMFLARRATANLSTKAFPGKDSSHVDSAASGMSGLASLCSTAFEQKGRENDHHNSGEEGAAAFVADTVKEGVKKATEVADAVGEGVKRTVDGAWRAGTDANHEVRETVAGGGRAGRDTNHDVRETVAEYGSTSGVKEEEEAETVVDQVVDEMNKVDGPVDMAEYRAMEENIEDSKQ